MAKEKLTKLVDMMFPNRNKGPVPSHWTKNLDLKIWHDNYKNLVKIEDLYVNHEYQRQINRKTMMEIAENFETVFSTPILVDRKSMEIVDGQQHAAAAYYRGDIEELPVVYIETPEGIDPAEHLKLLAKAFIDSNKLKRMITPLQKFKSAYVAQDNTVVSIEDILEKHGFCCGRQRANYVAISSPSLITSLYAEYGATEFDNIIAALSNFSCMNGSPAFMLHGIGMLHQWIRDWNRDVQHTQFNVKDMVQCACDVAGAADLYEAIRRAVTWHGTVPNVRSRISGQLVAREIQARYNVWLKKHKKPEIREDYFVRIGDR